MRAFNTFIGSCWVTRLLAVTFQSCSFIYHFDFPFYYAFNVRIGWLEIDLWWNSSMSCYQDTLYKACKSCKQKLHHYLFRHKGSLFQCFPMLNNLLDIYLLWPHCDPYWLWQIQSTMAFVCFCTRPHKYQLLPLDLLPITNQCNYSVYLIIWKISLVITYCLKTSKNGQISLKTWTILSLICSIIYHPVMFKNTFVVHLCIEQCG